MVVNLAWWILQSLLIFKRSFIGYACSVKMALDFQRFHGPRLPHSLRSMKTKGKKLGQYQAIMTSRLVNNTYLYNLYKSKCVFKMKIKILCFTRNFRQTVS